jgi:hypothetical protein
MRRPQYGIDAPGLLRFFEIAGVAAFVIGAIAWRLPIFGQPIIIPVSGIATTYLPGIAGLIDPIASIESKTQ